VGLLDAFSEPVFKKVIGKFVEDSHKKIIMDLSAIDFIDSSGLGALVQLVKKTKDAGGTLVIVTNPRVTQTVKVVRLDNFLSLHNTLEEAVSSFK
jgi:anti-anti-sigma factor